MTNPTPISEEDLTQAYIARNVAMARMRRDQIESYTYHDRQILGMRAAIQALQSLGWSKVSQVGEGEVREALNLLRDTYPLWVEARDVAIDLLSRQAQEIERLKAAMRPFVPTIAIGSSPPLPPLFLQGR